jgi:hypothetical protein
LGAEEITRTKVSSFSRLLKRAVRFFRRYDENVARNAVLAMKWLWDEVESHDENLRGISVVGVGDEFLLANQTGRKYSRSECHNQSAWV